MALLRAFKCSTQAGGGIKKWAKNGELQIGGGKIKEVVTAGEKGTGRRGWETILSHIERFHPSVACSLLL